jgi:erythromycin esterase-like protein
MSAHPDIIDKADLVESALIVAEAARVVSRSTDYDHLVDLAGSAQLVLIGEASHGTQDFYATRARLTRQLIEDKGFRIVALEADWPDMLRVHRYITGDTPEPDAATALADFRRFPAWMWRNTAMVEFVEWLRDWNLRPGNRQSQVGLFGMDLYSMHASMEAVLDYLDKSDPAAAARARKRYGCFEYFGDDPQNYGMATSLGDVESCEDAVVAQMVELRRHYGSLIGGDGPKAEDEFFYAEQNARLVKNAEAYYRSMFRGRDESWNLRDAHMTETLAALIGHYEQGRSKLVVWAHNSHLGDARATDMSRRGEWNVGQLTREMFGDQVYSIGFSTYAGSVTAARDWGGTAERRQVRPGMAGSYEALFHATGIPAFWLDLRERNEATELLAEPRLQRAIGVIYRPETERWSHYFGTSLPDQFDAMIHIDTTRALQPLELNSRWEKGELPETYPEGL